MSGKERAVVARIERRTSPRLPTARTVIGARLRQMRLAAPTSTSATASRSVSRLCTSGASPCRSAEARCGYERGEQHIDAARMLRAPNFRRRWATLIRFGAVAVMFRQ